MLSQIMTPVLGPVRGPGHLRCVKALPDARSALKHPEKQGGKPVTSRYMGGSVTGHTCKVHGSSTGQPSAVFAKEEHLIPKALLSGAT